MTDDITGRDKAEKLRSSSKERFGRTAADYRASEVHRSGDDLETLLEWVDAHEGERAVDIACGGGHVTLGLARAGAVVTAVDITPEMLAETRDHLVSNGYEDAEFVEADAAKLPFEDDSFDIVTCRIAAHHFPDAVAFFVEAARVLRPGGCLGFQDQALPDQRSSATTINLFERLRDPSHNHCYTPDSWMELATRAGLAVERHELFDKQLDFEWWAAIQSCSPDVCKRLRDIMREAPEGMREWMQPEFAEDGSLVRFQNRQIVMLARKPARA